MELPQGTSWDPIGLYYGYIGTSEGSRLFAGLRSILQELCSFHGTMQERGHFIQGTPEKCHEC